MWYLVAHTSFCGGCGTSTAPVSTHGAVAGWLSTCRRLSGTERRGAARQLLPAEQGAGAWAELCSRCFRAAEASPPQPEDQGLAANGLCWSFPSAGKATSSSSATATPCSNTQCQCVNTSSPTLKPQQTVSRMLAPTEREINYWEWMWDGLNSGGRLERQAVPVDIILACQADTAGP